jgi:hypothetical protein
LGDGVEFETQIREAGECLDDFEFIYVYSEGTADGPEEPPGGAMGLRDLGERGK